MIYTCTYKSPLGNILLAADEIGLTGLWFEGQKYFANTLSKEQISKETPVLAEAKHWLDLYFSGEKSREKRIYPVKHRKTKQKPAFLATRTAKLLRFYYS